LQIQAHIGTRDKNSIRSHAQKYFIKLYKNGKPLPAKVAESGAGYTLSGKPLDPESAAAKQYLGKRFLARREEMLKKGIREDHGIENFNGERDNPLPPRPVSAEGKTEGGEGADGSLLPPSESSNPGGMLPSKEDSNDSVGAAEATGSGKKKFVVGALPCFRESRVDMSDRSLRSRKKQQKKKPFREADLGIDVGQMLYGDQAATFSKERLRDRKQWKSLSVLEHEHNPLTLVKTMKYSEGSQPFSVTISSNAVRVLSLRAHDLLHMT
jgi:protein MYSM1